MKKGIIIVILVLVITVGFFIIYKRIKQNTSQETINLEPKINVLEQFKGDMDRDGITDQEEDRQGLSSVSFDSDKDGVSDYDEINLWKTDPKNRDSDKDGFSDGVEIIKGYNPSGPGKIKK